MIEKNELKPGDLAKVIINIIIWGGILGCGIFINFFQLFRVNMIYYYAFADDGAGMIGGICAMLIGLGVSLLIFYPAFRPDGKSDITVNRISRALLPLLLLVPEFFLPLKVYTPIIFIAVVGIAAFRYFAVLAPPPELLNCESRKKWINPLIILFFTAIFVAYGYYLQKRAMDVMYIAWNDWGFFLETIRNTMRGKWFWVNVHHANFMGSRFCPGLLVLAPFLWLFDSVPAFFFISSVVLASGGFAIYFFCRSLKLSSLESLFFGCFYFIVPSFINMNLANFYGFHEVYLTIPAVLLTFSFYERKQYLWAVLLFFYSITIQETVPILWLGFGAVFFMQRKFKLAIGLILVSLACYFFINLVIFPWVGGYSAHTSMFRFAHLGNSMFDIALSPFSRPAAFWGHLMRPGTFYMLSLLLLPVFLLTLSYPLMLGAFALLFVFLCIEGSSETQNIMVHYQTMMLVVILLNTVYCYRRLKDGEVSRWFKMLLWKSGAATSETIRPAALLSTLLTGGLCFIFFAQTHFSKNLVTPLIERKSYAPVMKEFEAYIPEKVGLTASGRVAPHFFVRNDVFHDYDPYGKYPLQDYVLIDVLDPLYMVAMLPLRDYLLKSPDYSLEKVSCHTDHLFMLFKRGKKKPVKRPLVMIKEQQWAKTPNPIKTGNDAFAMKVVFFKRPDGRVAARFMLRVLKKVDYDVELKLKLSDGRDFRYWQRIFGNGVAPAYMAKPGETFILDALLPAGFGAPQDAFCELKKLEFKPAFPK